MNGFGQAYDPARVPAGRATTIRQPQPLWTLVLLFMISGLLLAKNFAANLHAFDAVSPPLLHKALDYEFIGNDGIATILAAAIGAVYVIRQVAYGLAPSINYTASVEPQASFGAQKGFWTVRLLNTGTGAAEIEQMVYVLALTGGSSAQYDYKGANRSIVSSGLTEAQDFLLWRFSVGGSITPDNRPIVFECDATLYRARLAQLDVVIWYRGRMGGLYGKRIVCIP